MHGGQTCGHGLALIPAGESTVLYATFHGGLEINKSDFLTTASCIFYLTNLIIHFICVQGLAVQFQSLANDCFDVVRGSHIMTDICDIFSWFIWDFLLCVWAKCGKQQTITLTIGMVTAYRCSNSTILETIGKTLHVATSLDLTPISLCRDSSPVKRARMVSWNSL